MRHIIITPADLRRYIALIQDCPLGDGQRWVAEWKRFRKKRSVPQLRLYFMWLAHIAEAQTGSRGEVAWYHEWAKRKWLTPKPRLIDGEEVLIYTTKGMDTKEMHEFMECLRLWALDHEIRLPLPGDQGYDDFCVVYDEE
jgi:hypothetical protein